MNLVNVEEAVYLDTKVLVRKVDPVLVKVQIGKIVIINEVRIDQEVV